LSRYQVDFNFDRVPVVDVEMLQLVLLSFEFFRVFVKPQALHGHVRDSGRAQNPELVQRHLWVHPEIVDLTRRCRLRTRWDVNVDQHPAMILRRSCSEERGIEK